MNLKDQVNETQKTNFNEETTIEKEVSKETSIPYGYIPIQLSSKGKFDCPETIHVRNYTSSDLLEISSQADDHIIEGSMKLLNNVVLEDIDTSKLTDKEVIEIYLAIYANWWGETIEGYQYPIEDEDINFLKEKNKYDLIQKIIDETFKPEVDLSIEKISIQQIADEFKEPIRVKDSDSGKDIYLRIPRIGDGIIAKKYINKLFKKNEEKALSIRKKLEKEKLYKVIDRSISEEDRYFYEEYSDRKAIATIEALQACMILSYDNKDDIPYEEKIQLVHSGEINTSVWIKFQNFLNKYPYGVQNNVLIYSPILEKEVERRFLFRPLDFIPTGESKDSDRYDISFG